MWLTCSNTTARTDGSKRVHRFHAVFSSEEHKWLERRGYVLDEVIADLYPGPHGKEKGVFYFRIKSNKNVGRFDCKPEAFFEHLDKVMNEFKDPEEYHFKPVLPD